MAKVIKQNKDDRSYHSGGYGSDFHYGGKYIKFPHIIRGLKSTRVESGYIDYVSAWIGDNVKVSNLDDFGDLATYLMFFSHFCEFTDEFIKKYDVKPYHISLMRRMYFDYDDYEKDTFINLGYKRPYGNSHVLGDVADEYLEYEKVDFDEDEDEDGEDRYEWMDDNSDMLLNIHMRTLEIFDLALEELNMALEYECTGENFNYNWKVTQAWYREHKLERILR